MSTAHQERAADSAAGASASPGLFSPFTLRGLELRNRIMISPMCQYSSVDGLANDWHLVHLGARAVGGAALVMVEATAVTPEGRISPQDMGIWGEQHIEPLARIARFVAGQGAAPATQLAHAGRKASTYRPWSGRGRIPEDQGGWKTVAPSAIPFSDTYTTPRELSESEIAAVVQAFADAAQRSLDAGMQVIELHGAHGYLIHEFLSPLSNQRTDRYGGSFDNRIRFAVETVRAVRRVWPDHLPLFMRLSCTDWVDGGWTLDDSVRLSEILRGEGVDLIDCSSGGTVPNATIPTGPLYQVPFAVEIRHRAAIPTAAVGLITEPEQADHIINSGDADLIALARAELRDPNWPLHAAKALGHDIRWPAQYDRAKD